MPDAVSRCQLNLLYLAVMSTMKADIFMSHKASIIYLTIDALTIVMGSTKLDVIVRELVGEGKVELVQLILSFLEFGK